MSNFKFKQFSICHDCCAMKVGTDGVLLGAWAELPEEGRILDIGTGTGLIAIMAAQRAPHSLITGIDIDKAAAQQAEENATHSPFAERIQMQHIDLEHFSSEVLFDVILCNPPFFEETLLSPNEKRNTARHTCTLTFETLVKHSVRHLREGGTFQVIIPSEAVDKFRQLCFTEHLYLSRLTWIKTTERKNPKRALLCFEHCRQQISSLSELIENTLILMENGMRTAAYQRLTADFYL